MDFIDSGTILLKKGVLSNKDSVYFNAFKRKNGGYRNSHFSVYPILQFRTQ